MKLYPKRWLLFLAAWLPAEDFVLKWLPVPDLVYVGLRSLSEVAIYGLAFGLFLSNARRGVPWRWSRIGWVMVLFSVLAIASFLWHGGELFNMLVNLRTLMRYFVLFLLVVNLDWTEDEVRQLTKVLLVAALVQCTIGWLQFIGPPELLTFFEPRETDVVAGQLGLTVFGNDLKLGAVFGTYGKPGQFALFMLFASTILMARGTAKLVRGLPWREGLLLLFLAGGVFMSYKRGPLLVFLMLAPVMLWIGRRRMLAWSIAAVPVLAAVTLLSFGVLGSRAGPIVQEKEAEISPIQSIMQLTTSTYWQKTATASRGWFIFEVGGHAVQDIGPLGYGPDDQVARHSLARNGGAFSKLIEYAAFEDVFWVAMFLLYGPLGLALFWYGLWLAFATGSSLMPRGGTVAEVGAITAGMVFITMLVCFLERALEMRTFAFYLWLFMGLSVVAANSGFSAAPGQARSKA